LAEQFRIIWRDSGREPQCPPNPAYPEGIDLDISSPGLASCQTPLPYPARRCGVYIVSCLVCGLNVAVTTAGRPDDPRSARIPCKPHPEAGHG
jgi:hypothetical protein